MRSVRCWAFLAVAALALTAACSPVSPIREAFDRSTPHEKYAASLAEAGLAETAMGREWLAAGDRGLREAVEVVLPYHGAGYFAAERPAAAGYRLALRRGQRLDATVEWRADTPGAAFLDLFRVETPADRGEGHEAAAAFRRVAGADTAGDVLSFEVPRDGVYVLRLQTELLRSAGYRLTLLAGPTLGFPVEGHDHRAIRSVFGDVRDGGRRDHHGVDIFAPRGTPVLAATEGRVARVGTNRLGGNVIWLRDEARGLSFYYAHLDRHLVRGGERVAPGDTVGLVGNTGNARTTPPHLHFGIYSRGEGPLDPAPFIRAFSSPAPRLSADPSNLGQWVRTTARRSNFRVTPGTERPPLETLGLHTPLLVSGATADWYRAALPDGRGGFVSARLVEPAERPVAERPLPEARPLLARPAAGGLVMDTLPPGSSLSVLAAWEDYLLISAPDSGHGWVPSPGSTSD